MPELALLQPLLFDFSVNGVGPPPRLLLLLEAHGLF